MANKIKETKSIDSYFYTKSIAERKLKPESSSVFLKLKNPLKSSKAIKRVSDLLRLAIKLEVSPEVEETVSSTYTCDIETENIQTSNFIKEGYHVQRVTSSFTFDYGNLEGWEFNMVTKELEEIWTTELLSVLSIPVTSPSGVVSHMQKHRGALVAKKFSL